MRLNILNNGYSFGPKLLFKIVKLASGRPMPDAARIVFYRPDFYGDYAKTITQSAMRGPSEWSVADRELMAAYISKLNQTAFCIGAHTATATRAYGDAAKVSAVLNDLESAPISDPLRAALQLLGKLTEKHEVSVDDVREVFAAGATRQQIEDALAVCFAFNVTDRLADAFGFELPDQKGFEAGAKYLLRRGYK